MMRKMIVVLAASALLVCRTWDATAATKSKRTGHVESTSVATVPAPAPVATAALPSAQWGCPLFAYSWAYNTGGCFFPYGHTAGFGY